MADRTKLAGSFLGAWVVTNVQPAGYKAEGDLATARALAEECVALAAAQDFTRDDFERLVGDLDEHMRKAQNIAQKTKDVLAAPPDGQKP